MNLEELSERIIENDGAVQTVWAVCSVEYDGRAEGSTGRAERLLLFKPDGNIQVIGPEKHKPVNWQPTGASLNTEYEDGILYIYSNHPRTGDLLEVRVFEAHSYNAVYVQSDKRCSLEDTEEDYHKYIINNPSCIGLDEDASLEHEVSTGVGRIDLYEPDNDIIIEVKRKTATLDSVSQLNRYSNELECSESILVCPSITNSADELAADSGITVKKLSL